MSCDELYRRAMINFDCARLRLFTAIWCFDPPFTGPNDTHLQQIRNAIQTGLRCLEIYERNCLPPPRCPQRDPVPERGAGFNPLLIFEGVAAGATGAICFLIAIARTVICVPVFAVP
jgi:hypothetical protein